MSEEIDLDQSHLCTTEDAFEQFQAVSMYEEDEYITLSDIVPPQPAAPDLSSELNDIPYESEVVLDSNLEEQVPEVNSTIEICSEEIPLEESPVAAEHLEVAEEKPQTTKSQPQPAKRGRKKKTQQNDIPSDITKLVEQNGLQDVNSQENVVTSPLVSPRRRGRQPQNTNAIQPNNVTADPIIDQAEMPTEMPKRRNRLRSSNTPPSQNDITPKKTPGRRGRPRKTITEQPVITHVTSAELEPQHISKTNETNPPDIPVQKKRGRKKKSLEQESNISAESSTELKQLTELPEPSDISAEQQVSDVNIETSNEKHPTKKGKSKKSSSKPEEQEVNDCIREIPEDDDDDVDDICLSQLKSTLEETKEANQVTEPTITPETQSNGIDKYEETNKSPDPDSSKIEEPKNDFPTKRTSKQPVMEDFEYNIDSIVSENKKVIKTHEEIDPNNEDEVTDSLLIEDTSKRPVRRKTKQYLHYDEESDEDPFANVELSDEDDMRGKKGRYYSDDEYVPGLVKKRGSKHIEVAAESDTSDSDIDQDDEEIQQLKRKKARKSDGSPVKKRGRKSKDEQIASEKTTDKLSPQVSTIKPGNNLEDDDVEICLETSIIKASESKTGWGSTNEFQNFLAKKIQGTEIKIKKASTPVQPLEIPVIDPKEVKKAIEISTQTTEIPTTSTGIQTSTQYDIPMKDNVPLTPEQSENACQFLNSIVKTTAELGELMTQKSNDFIKKKINTDHVTDTFKMDYCVRKSFLLFKLAKHNLMQMEEDLAQQYDNFLSTHNLSQYREKPKIVEPEQKAKDSDSDCEIIETPAPVKTKKTVPFNPKTVFLNKELSIKIAKKPSDDKKLNIKGRHTVWINDSVMVKKVKPTQSFLAQDSRNKKPPDYITIEMVNAFFEKFNRKKALKVCAPFVSSEWFTGERVYACNYFFAKTEEFEPSAGIPSGSGLCEETESNASVPDMNDNICDIPVNKPKISSPHTLFRLCTKVLQNRICIKNTTFKYGSTLDHRITSKSSNYCPDTLYKLCVDSINVEISSQIQDKDFVNVHYFTPGSLKTLCYNTIVELLCTTCPNNNNSKLDSAPSSIMDSRPESLINHYSNETSEFQLSNKYKKLESKLLLRKNGVKSLFSLCFDQIHSQIYYQEEKKYNFDDQVIPELTFKTGNITYRPKSLKCLSHECIVKMLYSNENELLNTCENSDSVLKKVKTLADLCFDIVTRAFSENDSQTLQNGLTINEVNTLTEEAYHNIDRSELSENADDFYLNDDSNFYNDEVENSISQDIGDENQMENNWLSQVQMKISSCYDPNISEVPDIPVGEQVTNTINSEPILAKIKLEPLDDVPESVDTSIVKSEPMTHLDEMTIIPESIITKSEYMDNSVPTRESGQRQNSNSFDVDQFETFASTNKMMCSINYADEDERVFTQSGSRIRRQHEPDSDNENDMSMSLLVPHTYEPLPVIEKNKVKDSLMQSSSDESSSNNNKKSVVKKKPEKRNRGRPKKNETKPTISKELPKEKPSATNEIAILTRRMRDKIRQEEKKAASSDSESENIILKKGKEKVKAKSAKTESNDKEKNNVTDAKSIDHKPVDDEIQCSNVDSTEQLNDDIGKIPRDSSPSSNNFTGFSAVDQNEISSYHKYVKYVYDQIIPKDAEDANSPGNTEQPLINPEEPVELLECEPTMPYLMEGESSSNKKTPVKRPKPKPKTEEKKDDKPSKTALSNKEEKKEKIELPVDDNPLYVERHGWKCYPLNSSDTKLYQNAQILLEKLPESFVETYFRFQNISSRNDEDDEVDRLTNLQTLKRSVKEGVSDGKCKGRPKSKVQSNTEYDESNEHAQDNSRAASPANSEHYDELTPSEDEGEKGEEEVLPSVAKPPSANNLAKNSLMDENDSDEETRIKQEPKDPNNEVEAETVPVKKYKPGPKCKKLKEQVPAAPVMLTADKMMNKELNLLHAPINLEKEDNTPKIQAKGPATRKKQKNTSKTSPKERIKAEDDSSSEEEKQWFTIKEKLLKRMVKNKDTTREDDAKRAKLVSEFIERRGDGTEAYINRRRGVRGRRSKKKMLERQKQLRVLTRELFGDPSNDASLQRKKQAAAYFKGRRNIRKVLDKKSLTYNTVVANKEEFERKRRLTIKQTKLRDILGCEEGVNVLVINDEVCLEYDFEQHRPVVTIHQFFTKVMKAHQYEGVKFMWDACFESLESIAGGTAGGGCILAHCMGLGKTLQVLALLHTVLTHPGVGMHRVLVCCPLSTVLNWVDEIHKWIGPVTNQIKVFELSKLRKTYERAYQLEDWYNGGGIFIIGYELFRSLTTLDPFLDDVRPTIVNKIRTALLDPGPDIIICDEGHLLKNDCSVLAVAMSRVATKRRIVLTGTPMQNNLREYYCMVNFVKPNLLGTYAEYSNRFENPIMNGQHRDSSEEDIKLMKARTHILHKVLEGCLQRQEASVLYPYLPKKHEYTVFISLTKCQWDLYKHYLLNYGNTQNNKSILKDFHILQKIWSHPQVLHNFQMRLSDENKAKQAKVKVEKLEDDLAHEDLKETVDIKPSDTEVWWLQYLEGGAMLDSLTSSNKFVAVFRILDESVAIGDKVLIFSTSLFTMDTLEFFLKKIKSWSLGHEYYRLDGSVPAEVRQKWCREFNAENNHKTKLFLISTRAGSLGLNMTAANRVIILDTSWNPAHDIQSIFRVYRFGQKKDCYIYRLVAMGTMEQKIYERSVTKQAVACRVVDEQQIDRHYNMAELTELYKFDEAGVGVAGGVAVGVEDVVLLRVARDAGDAALHAVHEHDSLLRGSGEQGLPEHERNAAWMQFQQEHAHKQAFQQAMEEKELKREQELLTQENKGTAKRPTGKYAKLKLPIKKEETEESILPEPTPPPAAPKQRGRKPKKNNFVSCCIPIQPETQAETDIDMEAAMVKKIADILLRYNFQSYKTPDEISSLVSRVRQIVTSGQIDQLDCSDELTMSLVNVFLQKEATSVPPVAPVPEVLPEKPEVKVYKPKGRKKGSGRQRYVYEEIPSTSAEPPKPEPDVEGSRTRRRAALAAEKNFDTISDTIVDIEDDDWQNDDCFSEAVPTEEHVDKPAENARQSKKTLTKTVPEEQISDIVAEESVQLGVNQFDSILLSDDEEIPPSRKKPGPARKTRNRQNKESKPEPIEEETPNSAEPPLPLHPSLLSNKNFIKIVAHTYLSGNPMLDEDAATLAAQYSTFKALKEYESTGKAIESGPIFDIAVKVLGRDVLRKLNTSKKNIDASEIIAAHPINSKDSSISTQVESATKPEVAQEEKKPVKIRIRIPPLPAKMAAAGNVSSSAPGANVVPVGLYKSAEGPSVTADECILPDDDDIHIISDPTPPPAPAAPAAPKPLITLGRRNSTRLLVHNVKADQLAALLPAAPPRHTLAPAAPPTPPPAPPAPAPKPSSEMILSDLNAPISLDSDDEDIIVPHSKSPPTPVLLRPAIPPPGEPLSTATTTTGRVISVVGRTPTAPQRPAVPISLTKVPPPPGLHLLHKVNSRTGAPNSTSTPTPIVLNYGMDTANITIPQQTMGGNIFLVPASKYNPAMNAPTPVTESSASTSVPQPARPAQEPSPVPAPGTPVSQSAPTPQPPLKTQNTPKTQPQPKTQTLLKTQTSTHTIINNGNKRVCKPGDILRITESGSIEVLQRKDVFSDKNASSSHTGSSAETPTKSTEPTQSSTKLKVTTTIPTPPKKPEPKKNENISSRKGSSSTSDNDPLSILRDVIHIEADDYDTKSAKTSARPNQTSSKPNTTAEIPKMSANSATSKKSVEAPSTSSGKWHQVLSHKSNAQKNDMSNKNVVNKSKKPIETPSRDAKKTASYQNKTKERILGSVDLTDIDAPVITSTPSSSKKPKALKGATTIVGTSKSIILCGSGKAVTKLNTGAEKRQISVTSGKQTETASPSKNENKRAAPVDTSAAKKKKTDKPMTLKDFDIDDIDDIIELD